MSPTENLNPQISLIRQAIKAVPAVKYALGVAGIFAVIAIVKGFGMDYRVAVFGAVLMFVLMTVLVIFARLAAERKGDFRIPALTFTWFALILTMATALALFTSVFIGWPLKINSEKPDRADKADKAVVQSEVRLPSPVPEVKPLQASPNPSAEPSKALESTKVEAGSKNDVAETQSSPQKLPRQPAAIPEPANLCCKIIPKQLSSDPHHNYRFDYQTLVSADDSKIVRCEAKWQEIMLLAIVGQDSEKANGTIKFSMSKPEFECNMEQRMTGQTLYKTPKPEGAMVVSDKLPDRTESVTITPGDSPYSFNVNFDAVDKSCKDILLERKVKEGWIMAGPSECNLGLATAYSVEGKPWSYITFLEGPYNSATH